MRGESVIVKDTAACPGGAGVKEAEEVAERVARAESVGERVAGGDAVAKAVGSVAVALCEEMVVMEAEGELKNEGEALIDAVDGTESVAPGDGVTTEDGGTVGAVDCEVGGVGSPLADAKEGVGSDVPTSELLARPDALPSMVGVAVLVPPPQQLLCGSAWQAWMQWTLRKQRQSRKPQWLMKPTLKPLHSLSTAACLKTA